MTPEQKKQIRDRPVWRWEVRPRPPLQLGWNYTLKGIRSSLSKEPMDDERSTDDPQVRVVVDAILASLKAGPHYPDQDEQLDVLDYEVEWYVNIVEMLNDALSVRDIDDALNELYDWADSTRVWVE